MRYTNMDAQTRVHRYTWMYTYTACVCTMCEVYSHTHAYMCAFACMYTHVRIYAHIHARTHTPSLFSFLSYSGRARSGAQNSRHQTQHPSPQQLLSAQGLLPRESREGFLSGQEVPFHGLHGAQPEAVCQASRTVLIKATLLTPPSAQVIGLHSLWLHVETLMAFYKPRQEKKETR